jgi:hypothetical protein
MIFITVEQNGVSSTAEIPSENGPALRSALSEIRNEVGERLAGSHRFAKEYALTRASSALGALAGAVNHVIAADDPDYE